MIEMADGGESSQKAERTRDGDWISVCFLGIAKNMFVHV